jgi:hypothetical protein
MKKLFALFLVLCILLPAAAIAEAIGPEEAIDKAFDECPIDIMLAEGIKVSQKGGNWKISFGSKYGDFSYLVDGSSGEILEKSEPEINEKPADPASDALDACFDALDGYNGGAENIKLSMKTIDGDLNVAVTFDWNGKAYDMLYNTVTGEVIDNSEETEDSYYIIGTSEDTFAGLYKRMCINLDLKENPIPEPDTEEGNYGGGQYEYVKVLKNDAETYEYIGYVKYTNGDNRYIVRCWRGYHKDGAIIEMVVYYSLDGKYIGNIQRDRTAGTSTSSHNSPYFVPGEPMNHE